MFSFFPSYLCTLRSSITSLHFRHLPPFWLTFSSTLHSSTFTLTIDAMGFALHTYDSGYAPQPTIRRRFLMYTPRAQQAYEQQQFYFEQKERLATLLNTVGAESKSASFPACMEYPDLINGITQLLEEAQWMSGLTFAQIEQSGVQIAPFSEKVHLAESVAADVRVRAMATPKPVSRKRGRRDEDQEVAMGYFSYTTCNKRGRNTAAEYDMSFEPSSFCGPYADKFLQTAWWTQVCE